MFKHILESIPGVSIWPIIALFLFFAVFIAMIIYVMRMDKSFVNYMGDLPLDSSESSKNGDLKNGQETN